MTKQRINICVDDEIYLQIKQQFGSGKISSMVNDFFREIVDVQVVDASEQELLQQIQVRKNQLDEAKEELTRLTTQLIAMRDQRMRQEKQMIENGTMIAQTAKSASLAHKMTSNW